MKEDPRDRFESLRQIGLLTTIPFLLLAAPLVGYGLGWLLDKLFHTAFLRWIFTGLGFVAGVREVISAIRRASSSDEPEE